jgi:glycogen synthase
MKLLIYSHFFLPSVGGVETVVLGLARGLGEMSAPDDRSRLAITVVTQTSSGSFDDHNLPFNVVRRPKLAELWRLVRSSDIVHLAGPALAALILALLARKPVVVEHHGFQTICPNGQLVIEPSNTVCPGHFMAGRHRKCLRCNSGQGWRVSYKLWLTTFVRRFLCTRASANITPTCWLADLLQIPRTTVISHGLEPVAYSRAIPPLGAPVVVFQGRLVSTKGVRLLLEAARILHEQNYSFQVLIIGEGPERTPLEEFVRESGIENCVQFAGRLVPVQLDAALARASVVVAPSLGGEVFGLVVAENMQRGLPVIASDLGAFVEVIGDAGLTFHTGQAADLAAKLGQLFNSPELAAKLGVVASQRILNHFSGQRMLEDHLSLYEDLLRSIPRQLQTHRPN